MRASARAAAIYNSSSRGKLGLLVLRSETFPSNWSLRGAEPRGNLHPRGDRFATLAMKARGEDRHAPSGLSMTDGSHCGAAQRPKQSLLRAEPHGNQLRKCSSANRSQAVSADPFLWRTS